MLGLGAAPLGAQSGNAPFLANFNFTPSDATKAEAARIDAEERARRETAERQEYVPPPERQEYVPPAATHGTQRTAIRYQPTPV